MAWMDKKLHPKDIEGIMTFMIQNTILEKKNALAA